MSLQKYHEKFAYFSRLIKDEVHADTHLSVVIPAYNEATLLPSLKALYACSIEEFCVEVLVVFNASDEEEQAVLDQNKVAIAELQDWYSAQNRKDIYVHIIEAHALPKKAAGVGLARKIGMDEAALRFKDLNRDGIIIGFDADALCTENFLQAVFSAFQKAPKMNGCSIYFEHPLSGDDFPPEVYKGILNYELHLRYYNQAFRYTGHPFAFHTVGSSFAVRTKAYCKQGGMNKRKAGEDFYFIQKIISLGNYGELNSTKVIPSPRPSDRVPFGTGRAILKYLEYEGEYKSYAFEGFLCLKEFFQLIPEFYLNQNNIEKLIALLSKEMKAFLKPYFFDERLIEIGNNTSNINSFSHRFYQWFNAFMVLKFVHFYRDEICGLGNLNVEANKLLTALGHQKEKEQSQLLQKFRRIEKKTP